jgi:class 3 adenylate cyclase/TolB-like protein/Flp pilus assembly protein TadD
MSQTHQLAAIMFTDIVGYTALMGRDEQRAFDLLNKNRQIQKPVIEQHQGRFIKELGDGILASFSTVSDAVYAALEIQEACTGAGDFQLRIGIHHGEVVFDDNDVFGDVVNIASRIQAIAPPGGIYISESVERNTKNKHDIQVVFAKEERLKNVDKPEKIFQVFRNTGEPIEIWEPASSGSKHQKSSLKTIAAIAGIMALLALGYWAFDHFSKHEPTSPGSSGQKSIAVLPFKLIGDDKEGRYFADGVADELNNHLTGIENLKVRSRTSVEKYHGTLKTIPEIGTELNVDYILEGSAQKYKDDIRIIVQLINAKTDEHIWKNEYDRKYEDIFKVQSEIAKNIAAQLHLTLTGSKKAQMEKIPTGNKDAWDLFLKGKQYMIDWWKFREISDLDIATEFFRRSVKLDTSFAVGYNWLARSLWNKSWTNTVDSKQLLEEAYQYTLHSLTLDPEDPFNYQLMAYWSARKGDYSTAMKEIEKAISLAPENQMLWATKGELLFEQEKYFEALTAFKEAVQKEPTEFYANLLSTIGGVYFWHIGLYDVSDVYLKKSLEIDPDNLWTLESIGFLQLMTGKYDELLKIGKRMTAIRKDNKGLAHIGKAYMMMGDYQNALKAYQEYFSLPVEKISQGQERHAYAYVLRKLGREKEAKEQIYLAKSFIEKWYQDKGYDLAKVYSFLGDKKTAIEHLRSWRGSFVIADWMENEPLFDNIKNEPEFSQLAEKFKADVAKKKEEARTRYERGEFPTPAMIGK